MARRMPGAEDAAAVELSRALIAGVEEAAAALQSGRHRDDVAIHEFRKAMKRHRALLRLAEPLRGEAARIERREAGALARRLSGARDLTASLEGLDDLVDKKLIRPDLAAPVREALEAARRATEAASLDTTVRADVLAFLASARAAAERLADADLPLRALIAGLAKGFRRMVHAAPDDWSAASAESLHELRKAAVIHRYQMELARPLWPRPIEVWIDEVQKLRDRLGQGQDLEALSRFLASASRLLDARLLDARRRARLTAAIRTRQGQHIAAAEQQMARLAAERPHAFAERLLAYAGEQRLTTPRPEAPDPMGPAADKAGRPAAARTPRRRAAPKRTGAQDQSRQTNEPPADSSP
ncbi:CHAD domain-containing protein [Blastochloris sulfoviridis]|uniref:CHAD domain-containing protein n=1 Tax=Blastochloris sulfoviridis TaxID=50712 RepID=A0A5M6HQI5_9HYPH|nr:CHAD domain-containing protein [Blastochloris sulfoviridis]KAA5598125.1 CHAD domain-containing protein [Blastochloris sulfoviridis]